MVRVLRLLRHLVQLTCTLVKFLYDASYYLLLCLRPASVFAAESFFLRKQLALYQERNVKPRRATNATRKNLSTWRYSLEERQRLPGTAYLCSTGRALSYFLRTTGEIPHPAAAPARHAAVRAGSRNLSRRDASPQPQGIRTMH